MRNFPLNPFLESIKDDIPICVRDYERMIPLTVGYARIDKTVAQSAIAKIKK
ncbi:hypothetical protein MHK_002404 [Candidatus Magnetomorum sp. HK-1]|nr:hypothetical protein MHK_002404 [Candidatus Magnetomorum sp. HK-1]